MASSDPFVAWVAGSFAWGGIEADWHAADKPLGPLEFENFVRAIAFDVGMGIVLFVFGMAFAVNIFGAFRGPGSTPGPVMRDMSRGDYDAAVGDAPPR